MECIICSENINNNIITTCNHEFHLVCLIEWVLKNDSCPICRKRNPIHDYLLYEYVIENIDILKYAIDTNNYNFVKNLLEKGACPNNLKSNNEQINKLLDDYKVSYDVIKLNNQNYCLFFVKLYIILTLGFTFLIYKLVS